MLKETFVDKGLLKMEYVAWYRDLFALYKNIAHGQVTRIKGTDVDLWQARAEEFMKKMMSVVLKVFPYTFPLAVHPEAPVSYRARA
jgi:uncharacterized protein (UPF0332 family)